MRSSPKTRIAVRVLALLGWAAIAILAGGPAASEAADAGEATATASSGPASVQTPVGPEALGFDEIVFVKRKPYSSDHYYTDHQQRHQPRPVPARQRHLCLRSSHAVGAAGGHGRRAARRPGLHRQDQPLLRCEEAPVRFSPGSRRRFSHLGSERRRHGLASGLVQPPADEAEKAARWSSSLAHRRHPSVLSARRQDHLLLDPLRTHGALRRVESPGGPGPAPHGRRRHARRTAHQQPGERILPGGSRRRPGDVSPLGIHRQGRPGGQDALGDESRRDPAPGTLRSGRRRRRPSTCTLSPSRATTIAWCAWERATIRKEAAWARSCWSTSARASACAAPTRTKPDYVQGDERYPVDNITPEVFIQRRTEPGWQFLTKDGRLRPRSRRPQRAPVHPSVSRQRARVPRLVQGQSPRITTRRSPTPMRCI